jgi:hypothetical protein
MILQSIALKPHLIAGKKLKLPVILFSSSINLQAKIRVYIISTGKLHEAAGILDETGDSPKLLMRIKVASGALKSESGIKGAILMPLGNI